MEVEVLTDWLLEEAWRSRADWEPEIRLLDRIGDAFGTFSPRSLAELDAYASELAALTEQMKTYTDVWKKTFGDLKQSALRSFLSGQPKWRDRLKSQALEQLDAQGRSALLDELLPKLAWYVRGRPQISQRIEDLAGPRPPGLGGKVAAGSEKSNDPPHAIAFECHRRSCAPFPWWRSRGWFRPSHFSTASL